MCLRTPSGDSRRAFFMALLETAGDDGDGELSERARVQRLSLLSMEKLSVEFRVGLGFGERRIGRKKRLEVRKIRGSGILMKKEKSGEVLGRAPPCNIFVSIFWVFCEIINCNRKEGLDYGK